MSEAFVENSLVEGILLTTLIAPPVAFWPKRVPCGPLATSIRSTSTNSDCRENGDAINMPSRWYATDGAAIAFWFVSLPTPLMDITVLYPSFLATVTPGTIAVKSTKDVIFFASNSESVIAVTAWETVWRLSSLFSAVTITSSMICSCDWIWLKQNKKTGKRAPDH